MSSLWRYGLDSALGAAQYVWNQWKGPINLSNHEVIIDGKKETHIDRNTMGSIKSMTVIASNTQKESELQSIVLLLIDFKKSKVDEIRASLYLLNELGLATVQKIMIDRVDRTDRKVAVKLSDLIKVIISVISPVAGVAGLVETLQSFDSLLKNRVASTDIRALTLLEDLSMSTISESQILMVGLRIYDYKEVHSLSATGIAKIDIETSGSTVDFLTFKCLVSDKLREFKTEYLINLVYYFRKLKIRLAKDMELDMLHFKKKTLSARASHQLVKFYQSTSVNNIDKEIKSLTESDIIERYREIESREISRARDCLVLGKEYPLHESSKSSTPAGIDDDDAESKD